MSSSNPHIAIYGAVAEIPPQLAKPLPWVAALKRNIKVWRDVYRLKHNKDFHCDYRDYGVDHESNIGDIAIAETIRRDLLQHNPACVFINVDWGNIARLQPVHKHHSIDSLVVAGGGYFLFNHAGRLPRRLRDDLEVLRTIGIPYVFWGVGVNQPFNPQSRECQPQPTQEDEAILRALLDGAALITVRDEYSAGYLAAYTQQTVHLVGDPALHTAASFGLDGERRSNATPIIGLNFPFHGPSSNKFLLDNLPAYARSLQVIQRESNCRYRYITHHACEYVVPRLLRASGLSLEIVHADLGVTCAAYRDLDLHIGGMLHSCILAASVGTPWITIAYDIKHQGLNQLMGMDHYYQDTLSFSESALTALALKSLHSRQTLRAHIETRRADLHKRTAQIAASALAGLH